LFEFLVLVVIVKGDEGRRSLHVIKEVWCMKCSNLVLKTHLQTF
jgi:hypothetical protein